MFDKSSIFLFKSLYLDIAIRLFDSVIENESNHNSLLAFLHVNLHQSLLFSMISSNFPITFKIDGMFLITIIILTMLAMTDVNVKTANSLSWIESASITKNISVVTKNKTGGSKYSKVFQRNVRVGFGCDGKKPIVWHSFWIHRNNFIPDFIDAAHKNSYHQTEQIRFDWFWFSTVDFDIIEECRAK